MRRRASLNRFAVEINHQQSAPPTLNTYKLPARRRLQADVLHMPFARGWSKRRPSKSLEERNMSQNAGESGKLLLLTRRDMEWPWDSENRLKGTARQ